MRHHLLKPAAVFLITCLAPLAAYAQAAPVPSPVVALAPVVVHDGQDNGALLQTLTQLDAGLSQAYNQCATQKLRSYFATVSELHFAGRGSTHHIGSLVDDARSNICGKLRRESLPDTYAVYRTDDRGAIQTGSQRFCKVGKTGCDGITSKFVAVWRLYDGQWRIAQLIRYAYMPIASLPNISMPITSR